VTSRAAAAATAAAALLASAALAVCGRDTTTTQTQTRTVQRETRVEVTRPGATVTAGRFDPQAIYERESPGVVTVIAGDVPGASGGGGGLGSGFVLDGDGEVATNAHVVTRGKGSSIEAAGQVFVRFQDRNQVAAEIVGFDPFADVALLKVDPAGLTLRPLPLGSTERLVVGSPVAAIGSPFGEEQSLSTGVISATDRSIESLTGFETAGAVQTDAAINQGNSGGPLLDAEGRVLGINSQIRTATGEGSGVGFAVPVDLVRRSLDQLRRDGKARYAYLGLATAGVYPQLAQRFALGTDTGAWVQEVTPGGPAERAGLRGGADGRATFQGRPYATGGDVITAVEGSKVRLESDVSRALQRFRPGETVVLHVLRDGRAREIRVKLGERPLDAPR
jgi:S1-C subfamily serine protease